MQTVFWLILLYFAYRFVFHFMIPLVVTAGILRKKFRTVQERSTENEDTRPQKSGEYIDFEEI
jgi:hypothetical protein